jgi:hypothetical protein
MCQGAGSRSHVWGWRLCVKGQVPLRQSRTTGGRLEALFFKYSDCVRGALKPVPAAHPARHCSSKLHLGELSAAQIGHFQRSETTLSEISSSQLLSVRTIYAQ